MQIKKLFTKSFNKGSLKQWALTSFFIVSLPLIFSIFYTVFEMDNYADKSQSTLFKAVHETESTRIILERLTSMERNIRQIPLFGVSVFYNLYQQNRTEFLAQMNALKQQEMGEELIKQLMLLTDNESSLNAYIISKLQEDNNALTQEDLNAFDQLTQQARTLLSEAETRVSTKAAALSVDAETVTLQIVYLAIISIFFALLLSLRFVVLLIRPFNDLSGAIRTLGDEGFEQSIAIRGPKDLQILGEHLEWLRVKLENLENEKQQFIRNVSHELKTPLATLKEGTDLLSENVVGILNTEQQEIIQLMKIGNININDLVENLLEYQRTISTKVVFNCSTFKLESLITHITNDYELLLRSKSITLETHLEPIQISADYEKLKIIISNVFSNAVKFSPPNCSIQLILSSSENQTTLIVEDQGPGIPKKIQPLMFKDFFHGAPSSDWKIKASGLGLTLVKHYLDVHHGSIKLLPKTKSYCGARFSIHLPLRQKQFNAKIN